jgi:hypothetical protein
LTTSKGASRSGGGKKTHGQRTGGKRYALLGEPMSDCEAEERNLRALYILENEWGCGRIDVGKLQKLLRGEDCDHD